MNTSATSQERLIEHRCAIMPDFVIVGAMKAGTTTLYQYLQRHPHIFLPRKKEPQFFSRDHVFDQGIAWYHRLFDEAKPDQVCGEASTCYSRYPVYPHAAERLAQYVPDARLIYILRHPVERLYSHYVHEMTIRFVRGTGPVIAFERFADEDAEAMCAGRYMTQIEHLMKYFDESSTQIILLNDLCSDPARVLDAVQRFIGVEPVNLLDNGSVQANSADKRTNHAVPRQLSHRWAGRLRKTPGVKQIADALPTRWRRRARTTMERAIAESSIGRRQASKLRRQLSPLRPETRRELCDAFADDIKKLEQYLQRDLPHWMQ